MSSAGHDTLTQPASPFLNQNRFTLIPWEDQVKARAGASPCAHPSTRPRSTNVGQTNSGSISGTTGCSSWRAPRTSTFLITSSRSWIRSDSASTTPAMQLIEPRLLAKRPTANFRFQHELALDSEKPPLLCRPEGVLRFDFSPGKRLARSLSELHLLKSRGLMAILTKFRAHSPSLATSVAEAIA